MICPRDGHRGYSRWCNICVPCAQRLSILARLLAQKYTPFLGPFFDGTLHLRNRPRFCGTGSVPELVPESHCNTMDPIKHNGFTYAKIALERAYFATFLRLLSQPLMNGIQELRGSILLVSTKNLEIFGFRGFSLFYTRKGSEFRPSKPRGETFGPRNYPILTQITTISLGSVDTGQDLGKR